MKKILILTAIAVGGVLGGCSESVSESARLEQGNPENIRTVHSTRRVYAKNIIPRAANLGDDWIEVDKRIVTKSKLAQSGSGATADSNYALLNADAERVVAESRLVKTIARSVYSNYAVAEPVALSVTWVMNGRPIKGFTEKDLYTLNRISGFTDWKLEEKGIAVALPTGDIYPGAKDNMFAMKEPVAVYLAVDGGLVEVRASGKLEPKDFAKAIKVVKQGLWMNIRPDDGTGHQPENTKVFWNTLKECML